MAMYQAAVSNKSHSSAANVLEESETRTVPGGLAQMKKQFEMSGVAASHSAATQYQYQHKAVKETRRVNEVTFMSSSQATEQHSSQSESQSSTSGMEQILVHEQSTREKSRASNYNQEADGVDFEEIPKISTQILKEQFERPFKEKAINPSGNSVTQGKNTKIYNDYPEFEWPVVNRDLSGSASRVFDATSKTASEEHTSTSVNVDSFGSLEEFPPPPPPDSLETADMAEFSQSPELISSAEQHAPTATKDLYAKQRNLYELKRLYKHIHPEVRKHLQKDYNSEVSDIVTSQSDQKGMISNEVQQAKYAFENSRDSPQKCISPEREYLEWDEILKGEVQSMRWVFENQPLDSIKDDSQEQSHIKSIGEQEIIAGGDVKYATWMFETQPIHALSVGDTESSENAEKVPDLARGDVRTATWLFETQPLDSLNKIYKENESSEMLDDTEDIRGGDVKTGRHLFETQFHDGRFSTVDEVNMLRMKSELQEIRGDVRRTVTKFETEPKYVLKDSSGKVLEIKTVCREDIEKGDVKTARWLFETQPLDTINQDEVQIKVVRGISMEESVQGGVGKAKWLFETQPLDSIKEEDILVTEKEAIIGADVYQKCRIFETLPMDMLKDNANERPLEGEEIIGGNVSDTKHLFETVPMDELKESITVGKLKQVIATEEERGDVQHQRWVFETKPLEHIGEEKKDYVRTVQLDEIHKGDVSNCKNAFERADWKKLDFSSKIQVADVNKGSVKLNRKLFETTPLYAIQDRFGHYHEVQTIRQEEVVRGDVRTCQWMFETIPIDQFGESGENYQIIKGISSQEIVSGDVKTGKWLFETQPLDSIKYFSNVEDEEAVQGERTEIDKGDVKTCKWLFETQPMEALYDKEYTETTNKDIQKGDVKTCTWLFETQPLDSIQDDSEKNINAYTSSKETIEGINVETVCFLFETQNLESIQGEEKKDFKRIVEVDVQSGDVSTMKYIFENQALDKISSSSQEVLQKIKSMKSEDLQNGNVLNCRWLFENHSINEINGNLDENKSSYAVTDVQGGNVRKGCFIFETFSLDQIRDASSEDSVTRTIGENDILKGDVKNYTLMFETQPLYAIQDKDGHYHEVTTVKKEEVSHGNVRGTRWLFETKALDSFNDSDEVFVIKAVTQEDIKKGEVNSVRWRFETQSLDKISDEDKAEFRTVDCVEGGNVKANKQFFESEDNKNQFVRTVSISEIKQGNVKTSTWLFETHTMDEIHGEDYEDIKTVTMEDIHKGDVQESVWLFENQNLDSIGEEEENVKSITREEIPQADVRTTTWLFETTPLSEFNEHRVAREDIVGKNIHETLKELYSQKIVESHGIILEADEIGDVRMAKYHLMNQEMPEIQKEEIIRGDLRNIMMNLLSENSSTERMVQLQEEEKGNITLTKSQLLNQSTDVQVTREDIVRGDIQEAIKNLFSSEGLTKQGILIQESEKGDIRMTVYSLLNKREDRDFRRDEVIGGDVKRTMYNLRSSLAAGENLEKVKIGDSERGNVQFYTTCIESGALDYLKRLQKTSDDACEKENEEIVGGDVEGTKLLLRKINTQVERTVDEMDIIPGDVYNTVKVFMTEPESKSVEMNKEVVKGNLRETLKSLNQAITQQVAVEKEEIIKADLSATLKSLTESQHQVRDTEKPDVIPGDIKRTIDSLEKAASTKTQFVKEDVIHGNLEETFKSLQDAQKSVRQTEKENIVKGDLNATLLESSTERKNVQHQASIQGDVKGTIKTLLQPSRQTTQQRASVDSNVKNSIKNVLSTDKEGHVENETVIKRGLSDGKTAFVGQSDASHTTKTSCKNEQSTKTSQQNVIETYDILLDNAILKNDGKGEINDKSGHNIVSRATICSADENNLHVTKSESSKAWKKHSTMSTVQAAEIISGEERCLLQGFSEGHEEKTQTDLINQNKVMQKAKLSASINTSKPTASQQPINVINRESSHTSGHVHKQVTNQQTQHIQHSRSALTREEVNVQQAQVLDSINNNVEYVHIKKDKTLAAKGAETAEAVHTIRNKSVQEFRGKSKTVTSNKDQQLLMRSHIGPAKASKQRENPDMCKTPPPALAQASSAQLPFPPPPPPLPSMLSFKANIEPENFPSPPPSVVDKLDNDILPPPPETPPPLMQHRDLANRKVTFSSPEQRTSHSEESQSYSNSASQSGIALSQSFTKTDKTNTFSEKQVSDVPQKSRLPVLQSRPVSQDKENKNVCKKTISEYSQKVSTSQSHTEKSEQTCWDQGFEIARQGPVPPKKNVLFSPRISPVSKTDIPSMKPQTRDMSISQVSGRTLSTSKQVNDQKLITNQSIAQDFDQLICDQELEQINEESFKPKKKVVFSPQISPAMKSETPPMKPATREYTSIQVKESKQLSSETIKSVDAQHESISQSSEQDLDQLACNRELERIHEETLKPKRRVFLPPRVSPALRTDTPSAKPQTYVRKFKTPLMIAEEKYRQQREEMEKNKGKVGSQIVTITSQENHVIKGLETDKSTLKNSLDMSITPTKGFDQVKDQLNDNSDIISNEQSRGLFDLSKPEPSQLVGASDVSSLSKSMVSNQEEQRKHEQNVKFAKEYNAIQQTKEQYELNKSEKYNKVDETKLVNVKTISPKLAVKSANESVQKGNKSETNAKQIHYSGSLRQNDRTSIQTKQRVTEECHKVHFCEEQLNRTLNAQSISHSSEQQQLGISCNIQAVCNEVETQKAPIKHAGIQSSSSNILKKQQDENEHSNTDDSTKRKHIALHEQSEILKSSQSAHQVHQKTSPPPKDAVKENKSTSHNIGTSKQVHETVRKKEMTEKRVQMPASPKKDDSHSTDVIEYLRKCEELRQTLSKANTFESDPHTLNINTFTTFLNIVPNWLISQEKKKDIADMAASDDADGITEQISYIKRHAMDMQSSFQGNINAAIRSSTTARSLQESSSQSVMPKKQVSAISRKVEKANQVVQEKRKISNEFGRTSSDFKQMDFRSCSPSLKTRSPSPTYITIESIARRIDSPHKDRPVSQSPLQKEHVTVPLPPKRSMIPKMKSQSPTPQKSRSEQLAKLKDTTAKLSHGTQPARSVTPIPIVVEKKCEIIHSPATLRRQLKIESHTTGSMGITPTPATEVAVSTVEDRTEIYEEARKSEVHKTHSQKDPKHIPTWLGPDIDGLDVISVTQKFDVPTSHPFERNNTRFYTREEGNIYEKSTIESKTDRFKTNQMESENSSQFRPGKGTFQSEQKKMLHQQIEKIIPEVSELKPSPHDTMKGKTRNVPIRQLKDPKENASKQIYVNRQHENKEQILKPMLHSETISVPGHPSGVDKAEGKVGRTRSSLNSDSIRSGFEFKHAPPTYEDVISGHMLDISATESPDEILKNFKKTWEESERVFKSLGYSVSDSSEIRRSYHQEQFITENAASGQGNLHCLSNEGLSNGVPSNRQTDLS
ncbi:xin actin-binding repeat-containing protein 2 isoform 1-T1 [Pelodytes ibericus]